MLKFADLLYHSTVTVYKVSEFNCFIVLKFDSLDFENCFAYEIVPIRDMWSVFYMPEILSSIVMINADTNMHQKGGNAKHILYASLSFNT